ncbi:MAG: hypothetical protein KDA60_16520 [Planctomycetales bacterium]|nr:hypothetical protein [Planctomycetales bacterium]
MSRHGWVTLLSIALGLAGAHASAWAEPNVPVQTVRYLKSNQTSKRLVGSAAELTGTIFVYHVFANDQVSHWTSDEKKLVMQRFRTGYEFIQKECLRHGHQVRFQEQLAPDVQLAANLPTDSFANPQWTENVILAASGTTGPKLVESLREENEIDHVAICLHIDKPALSYNLAYYDNVATRYAAERMVCFSQYPDTRPTSAATYAHEVFHLFGAGDLYFPYDEDDARKSVAQRMFPDDIMFRVDYDINRLYVGPFTAYRVGWTNSLSPEHRVFED